MDINIIIFLILFPLLSALTLLIPSDPLRKIIVPIASLVIIAASVYLLAANPSGTPQYFQIDSGITSQIMFYLEIAIALYLLYVGFRNAKYGVVALVLLQTIVITQYELNYAATAEAKNNLFIDQFTLIMALIIGVIGSIICLYALGYMRDYQHEHTGAKDNRNIFFFLMFLFISAMFGLVFSNNITWIYFFWEITTLCSFLLIGYSSTEEAKNNAFRALWMNLLGGLAFAAAIYYLGSLAEPVMELDKLMVSDKAIMLVPAVLISFAGITKSAQMPFSSWLTGAMVAPTPVSALLHSSTMVKAGVYIIVRLAPLLQSTWAGYMVALVGGFTFLIASAIAVSQSNAKRVLAYSTIANLGLVVACGGLGTYEAVWAAMLLIIFHAISKSLLFMAVGTVEHRIFSRDIEDMGGLIIRMPKIAVMMLIGMAGMFLAPFGMLISKWATLKAFVDAEPIGPLLAGIIAFGSAVTVFFWTKWMGKIISVTYLHKHVEDKVKKSEWVALYAAAALTVLMCLAFPLVSTQYIEPYIKALYPEIKTHNVTILSQGNIMIMMLMMGLVLVLPFSMLYYRLPRKHLSPYMGGRPTTAEMRFSGSAGLQRDLTLRNYYLESYFGENKLLKMGTVLCMGLMALLFTGIMLPGVF